MRVPCVRVRLPGRGLRAHARVTGRGRTRSDPNPGSESGIRIRSATLLRLLNTSCCRGRGRETCLPPHSPAAIATIQGLAVRPFILSFIPTQSELRTHLPQALSQAPAVVG